MEWHSEILRFQEGAQSQHPAPEAVIEMTPPHTPTEAGARLAVLVDLNPPLPHRSRELRTLAAEAYWHSSGSGRGQPLSGPQQPTKPR